MYLNEGVRRALWRCPFADIVEAWALVTRIHGTEGMRWLGRNDRFYLLARLLNRPDVLHPWLYARTREVEQNTDGYLDLWAREHYKDLANDTPILTTKGWVNHGDLQPGNCVFSPAGLPVRVLAVSRQYHDSACFRLTFSDGASIVAGAGHLWQVWRKIRRRSGGNRRRVEWVGDIVQTCDLQVGADIGVMTAPIAFPDVSLPVAPYTLGCWLGDGDSSSGRVGKPDQEIFDAIAADGYQLSENHCPQRAPFQTRTVYGLSKELRALGLIPDKFIPDCYLRASPQQRLALLRGLMDTDGHCNDRGTATFSNTRERLAKQVFELATGLGLRPRLRRYCYPGTGEYWQVSMQAHQDRNPFQLPRKAARAIAPSAHRMRRTVASIERVASVPTRCIQVEGGMYLAGRALIPTHNSTIITFAGIIQEILRDPEITIGIFSHTKPTARKFLLQIKQEFERNEPLIALYPDVLFADPRNESPKWSEEKGLVVRRLSNPKEATLEAHGLVDGQPTGSHFKLLVYDDVVTLESVSTPEQVAKTTNAWSLSDNLGARGKDGKIRKWHIGTRYSYADSYQAMMDMKAITPRVYAATENGLPDGVPVFLSAEAWEEKRRNQTPAVLAAQMLQNPSAGAQAMFRKEWLRFAEVRPRTLNVYIMCDPAGSRKKGSDYTAMMVVGVDAQGNKWLLDGRRHKMNLSERWQNLRALRKKWVAMQGVQRVVVGYERYGMQSDIEHFEQEMRREKDIWDIVELAWPREGGASKQDRIQRLVPDFMNGRFFLPAVVDGVSAAQQKMRDAGEPYRIFSPVRARDHEGELYSLNKQLLTEYLSYPYAVHDDVLDAVSRIYDMDVTPPVVVDEKALQPVIFEDGV